MRKTLLILLLFCSKLTFAQLNDAFSDGDFTNNPSWTGQTNFFVVNASKQLQANGPNLANQNFSLSTPNQYAKNVVWEFFVQLNFDPTSTNFTRVYLVSNQADLNAALQGYFFQVGETGPADGFHLYRQNGTATTQIITGAAKTRSNTNLLSAKIKITRDTNGKWELFSDVNGGTNYTLEGSVTDNTYTTTTHFGVTCRYATASRYNQFIYDDFKITELVPDVTPPKLLTVKSLNGKTVELTFDEPLNVNSVQNVANYNISLNVGNPVTATISNANNVVILTYATEFASGNYTLTANNIADIKGNVAGALTKSYLHIKPYQAKRGDIVINEIFADPTPVIGLPEKEYVELWNTTNEYIVITGWKYKDASTSIATFLADTLAPKQYLILCSAADVNTFKAYGKTLALSPWPSLNNTSDDLYLNSNDGTLIDQVSYQDTWYQDKNKKDGGYALELINPNIRCAGSVKWIASLASIGGTPGTENSVYKSEMDLSAPSLLSAQVVSLNTVKLIFDKAIEENSLTFLANYNANNGLGQPVAAMAAPDFKSVDITFSNTLTRGLESSITVTNLLSCAGIVINVNANMVKVFVAKEIMPNDILISEVLFNPKANGADFVEVYNKTDHVLDLKDLMISNPSATGTGATKRAISSVTKFIAPNSFWVITSKADAVQNQYFVKHPNQVVEISNMPSYNVGSGAVKLWRDSVSIDEFTYNDKMHIALLKDVKGVSLERVSFTKPTNQEANFQSAAATSGYATPTAPNSQQTDDIVDYNISLSAKTFSPDNDGLDDLLEINYQFKDYGNLATINIYTDKGVLVRKLLRNTSIATTGKLTWDGLNDANQLCKVGIYVIKIDVFNLNGKVNNFVKTCVLASKLN